MGPLLYVCSPHGILLKTFILGGSPRKFFKFIISQIKLSRILNTISFYFELGVGRSRLCFFTLIQGLQFAKTYRSKIYLGLCEAM